MGKRSGHKSKLNRRVDAANRSTGSEPSAARTVRTSRETGDEYLAKLATLADLERDLEKKKFLGVFAARRAGKSWSAIATAMGVTRQTVHRKYAEAVEDPTRLASLFGSNPS